MKIKLILSMAIMSSFSLISAMSETTDEMLYRGIRAGDLGIKTTKKAIQLGANVNIIYNHDDPQEISSPLSILVQRINVGHKIKTTILLLLESGADIDTKITSFTLDQNREYKKATVLDNAKRLLLDKKTDRSYIEEINNVIHLIETEAIWKKEAESIKKEINEHLIPNISDMIIQFAFLVKKDVKKDSYKEVGSLSI